MFEQCRQIGDADIFAVAVDLEAAPGLTFAAYCQGSLFAGAGVDDQHQEQAKARKSTLANDMPLVWRAGVKPV